jgi:hypothetical protein
MNTLHVSIAVFWLSFLLLCLLLGLSWPHRLLWVGLFVSSCVAMSLIQPRRPGLPPKARLLFGFGFLAWLVLVLLHGFLYPSSVGLLLALKTLCVVLVAPALFFRVCADHLALRSAKNRAA